MHLNYMLDSAPGTLLFITSFNPASNTVQWCYYHYFKDKETETEKDGG